MEENKKEEVLEENDEQQEEVEIIEEEQEQGSSELDELRQEKEELNNRLVRLQADYDNFRRRTQKEKEADRKYRSQSLIEELVPVLDNFERALQVEVDSESAQKFADGIKMVYNQFQSAMDKEGLEEIPSKGEEFDPNLHQAVMQVEDENYDSNIVVEELQKGYRLKDRVIRPAMVKVNQ
ncbi:nucleotide exchange factor GrpE [Halobacillus litoralis]|uniref:nucleotide exchange factor GrpE n=1 Tax=Halobacillus litoralis TaxID=45668 RepID=UPI001CD6AF5B|nr:nucleotide exchange factor GrpE [Halobacillus litoralis]MCA0970027.1 nucleotide exchange factor GrpE [Halobacillus litoralis]